MKRQNILPIIIALLFIAFIALQLPRNASGDSTSQRVSNSIVEAPTEQTYQSTLLKYSSFLNRNPTPKAGETVYDAALKNMLNQMKRNKQFNCVIDVSEATFNASYFELPCVRTGGKYQWNIDLGNCKIKCANSFLKQVCTSKDSLPSNLENSYHISNGIITGNRTGTAIELFGTYSSSITNVKIYDFKNGIKNIFGMDTYIQHCWWNSCDTGVQIISAANEGIGMNTNNSCSNGTSVWNCRDQFTNAGIYVESVTNGSINNYISEAATATAKFAIFVNVTNNQQKEFTIDGVHAEKYYSDAAIKLRGGNCNFVINRMRCNYPKNTLVQLDNLGSSVVQITNISDYIPYTAINTTTSSPVWENKGANSAKWVFYYGQRQFVNGNKNMNNPLLWKGTMPAIIEDYKY